MALVLVAPASAAWSANTVDSGWAGLGDNSLALYSSDNPRIAYYDGANHDLKYAVWDGSAWKTVTADSTGDVGRYTSLVLVSGFPRISYYDVTNHDLKYASWDGDEWTNATVDSAGDVGLYTSIASDPFSERARISYYDVTNGDLKYAVWSGAVWGLTTVDSTGDVGQFSSLALDSSGNPRISYYDATNGYLKYAAWNSLLSRWENTTVDSSGNAGTYCSLRLDASGKPRISYFDSTNLDLKYAAWNGTGWEITTVDSVGNVGQYSSLALDSSGNPHISYCDVTNADLKYAVWNGTSWTTMTVDSDGTVGLFSSLAVDSSGNARISYHDATNWALKFAKSALITDFSANQVSGPAPLTVTFTGTSADTWSTPRYAWSFGDGGSAFRQSPTYTYTMPGTYTVYLAADDVMGMNNTARVGYVTVTQGLTAASFTGTPTSGTAPLTVRFTDTSTNNPDSWSWDFGDGITTNATQQNPVHTYTAGGTYTVKLTAARGGIPNTATRAGYISVGSSYYLPPPVITAVAPITAARNQTVSFTVTGKNFQPGFTRAEFRNQTTGIINASLGTVTPVSITGTITIPMNASAGLWNLRVATTSGGDAVQLKVLTVTNLSAPTLTAISPANGVRNTTVTYSITGTNFEPGLTTVTFRNGTGSLLNTTALTSVTATRINGTIAIPPDAWIGAWNVNIGTVDGGSTPGTGKFQVAKFPLPAITSITPASAPRNAVVAYTIAGTNFEPGLTTVVFKNSTGYPLAVTTLTSVTATRINGTITVPPDASIGAWNVNVTTVDGGFAPGTGLFAVTKKAPVITAITPVSSGRNTTVSFSIAGSNFEPGTTTVVFKNSTGSVFATPAISSVTATRINGTLEIPPEAWVGAYNVNVTTQYGGFTPGTGLFSVTKTAPVITTITPVSAYRNMTVGFTITGTSFEYNTTTVVFMNSTGSVLNTTVLTGLTPTRITGTIMVPPDAGIGAWNVNISTMYGGFTPGTGRFTVAKYPAMTISSVTPGTIYRGTTVGYAIAGTNFEPGLSAVIFNRTAYGDVAGAVSSGNATLIRGTVTIPGTALNGSWNVVVRTADAGNVTKAAAVTVL
jgi:PKD repeat protein